MSSHQPPQFALWICENETVQDEERLHLYASWLSEAERQRWQRFRFSRHRQQFLVARALVRSILASYLNAEPAELDFTQNAWGKPQLQPVVAGLSFNLSHTDGLVVLAVDRGMDREADVLLGVDVENMARKTAMEDLARRYFSELECRDLLALPQSQQRQRFFDLWTLKEAYIKAVGKGLAIPLDSFSFHFGENVTVSFTDEQEDIPDAWRFWQYRYSDKHQIALALRGGRKAAPVILKGVPGTTFNPQRLPASLHGYVAHG